ncbi:MAG TPA: hypothetical protein VGE62_02790 [Candidatus Paceibacterota bacterium]
MIKNIKKNGRAGFTAVELMVVVGLAAMISGITLSVFSSFSDLQSLDKETDVVVAYVQKARNQSINSKGGGRFGINFSSSTVTLYEGPSYPAGAASTTSYALSSKVELSSVALTGGVSRVLFDQLTGKPNATGTVRLRLKAKPSDVKTVIIYGSGLVEVQQ